jgi:hypothetical protein
MMNGKVISLEEYKLAMSLEWVYITD